MKSFLVIALALCACVAVADAKAFYNGLVNKDVQRTVDVSSQFARVTVKVDVLNSGSKSASKYYVALRPEEASSLAHIDAENENEDKLTVEKVSGLDGQSAENTYYEVRLPSNLEGKGETKVTINMVLTHALVGYPAKILQTESQLVLFHSNHYFYSPYESQSQQTEVVLGTSNIEKHTELEPTEVKTDQIVYGPYEDVAANKFDAMRVHFENNSPFATAAEMTKEIEVSHWGNVAVEEKYVVRHDGAALKGSYSRLDYQRNPVANGVSSFNELKGSLPSVASDMYYRDEIGNISTSNVAENEDHWDISLRPRFPLFGGWKTAFTFGYNLPLGEFLGRDSNDRSHYVLNINFGSPLDDLVIDDLTIKVILPEGATNINLHTPFPVDSQHFQVRHTYLDTEGRPVLVCSKKNVVSEHNVKFQVSYHFSSTALYREPFLLIFTFFVLFCVYMLVVRLEFTLGKDTSEQDEKIRTKCTELFAKFDNVRDSRDAQYAALDAAIDDYLRTQKEANLKEARSTANDRLKRLAAEGSSIAGALEALDADLGKQAREYEVREKDIATTRATINDAEKAGRDTAALRAKLQQLERENRNLYDEMTDM